MRHAKKLIYTDKMGFLPEAEYLYADPLKKEKAAATSKISTTLRNPKLSQLEKHVKYQSLNRRRKKLDKMIETKPLHVVVESKQVKELPTSGIEQRKNQKVEEQIITVDEPVVEQEEQPPAPIAEHEEQPPAPIPEGTVQRKLENYKSIIPNNKYEDLADYVSANRLKFGITENGEIYTNKSNKAYSTVADSNFIEVIGYLTGRNNIAKDKKHITAILIKRLIKDANILAMMNQQGQGKRKPRYIIDLHQKYIKNKRTSGLIRKFRPTLWTKVPV